MLSRNLSFIFGGLAMFIAIAATTEFGAIAFLAPGFAISAVLFPGEPGTYIAQGAASPAQAMMELAIIKASERYSHALWCAIAFWMILATTLSVASYRRHRRARRSAQPLGDK